MPVNHAGKTFNSLCFSPLDLTSTTCLAWLQWRSIKDEIATVSSVQTSQTFRQISHEAANSPTAQPPSRLTASSRRLDGLIPGSDRLQENCLLILILILILS